MLSLDKVFDAQTVLKSIIRETNVVKTYGIAPDCDLYLKPENLQITGSFKVRGSAYKISQLSAEEKAKGVIACSAGNHAQGVALAATKNGIKSLICLPDSAPISKVEATKGYGAEVCLVEGVYDDAYNKAIELKEKEGYTFVHPFDDEDVIAGQGTIALEVLNDLDNIDAIVVPVGGGGLISGIAYTAKHIRPSVKVYGVQMTGAPSMYNSIHDGKIETLDTVQTVADGIAVKRPGDNTFEIVKKYVDDIALVSEDEVSSAILALIEKQKMIAEGAGAASVAAVMFNKFDLKGKRVAIPAALGVLIALNWETVFVLFHKIVFHNNYWIFDAATDPVITILPDTFFMHCALMILALVVLGSIICLLAYRHAKHKKTHTA